MGLVVGLARPLAAATLLALVALVPTADAATLKAKTSVTTKSGAARIVTKLTSDSPLGDRKRPRKVKVKAGGETYKLSRTRGASAAVVKLGTWRSDAYRGAAAQKLLDLAGDKVKVLVTSLAGTSTLRSKVTLPDGSTPPPGTDPPTPPDPEPGDITGQQAIDQMTTELRGGFVRDVSSSGSTVWEFHMCETGDARYYSQTSDPTVGAFAVEKFGKPWTVTDAIVKQNGDKAAIVEVVMTFEHNESGEQKQINEPFRTRIEYYNGQWYWEGELASTGQASCDPTF